MKIKRRGVLKLLSAIVVGGPLTSKAKRVENVRLVNLDVAEETGKPDCYIGLLINRDEWHGELYEVEGNGYARQGVKWKFITEFGECKLTNIKDITFPEAKAAWGIATHLALYVEPQGGVVLFTSVLSTSGPIGAGDIARFAAGDLDITID